MWLLISGSTELSNSSHAKTTCTFVCAPLWSIPPCCWSSLLPQDRQPMQLHHACHIIDHGALCATPTLAAPKNLLIAEVFPCCCCCAGSGEAGVPAVRPAAAVAASPAADTADKRPKVSIGWRVHRCSSAPARSRPMLSFCIVAGSYIHTCYRATQGTGVTHATSSR